jgi:hypothetical protein
MEKVIDKNFLVSVESKMYCINIDCANNVSIQHTCNLKGVFIDEDGTCSGIVRMKPKPKKKEN